MQTSSNGIIPTDAIAEANDGKRYAYLIALIMLIGFFCAYCYNYIHAFYWNYPYPYNTFLFNPMDHFMDFFILLILNKDLNPYLVPIPIQRSAQYPFTNFIAYLLRSIPENMACAIYFASTLIPLWLVLYQRLKSIRMHRLENILLTLIISMFSYPVLFTLDRGNFEGMLFSLVLLFWIFFEKKSYWISTILLSMSIAIKGFPIVLIVLFFSRNKLKYILGTMVLASVFTIMPLFIFQGGFIENAHYILSGENFNYPGFKLFLSKYAYIQRSTSLFTFLKIQLIQYGLIDLVDMAKILKLYFIFAISIFIVIATYILREKQALWKKAVFLTFAMVFLPHISADYRLIYIFIPLILFLSEKHTDIKIASFFWDIVRLVAYSQAIYVSERYYDRFRSYRCRNWRCIKSNHDDSAFNHNRNIKSERQG